MDIRPNCDLVGALYALQSYKKEGLEGEPQIHKIRITLTSRNVKSLEKGTSSVLSQLHLSHGWVG